MGATLTMADAYPFVLPSGMDGCPQARAFISPSACEIHHAPNSCITNGVIYVLLFVVSFCGPIPHAHGQVIL